MYFALLQLSIQLVSIVVYLIVVHFLGLNGHITLLTLFNWGLLGWLASLGIIAIQLSVAIIAKSLTINLLVNFGFVITLISPSITSFYSFSQMMIGLHVRNINPLTTFDICKFGLVTIGSIIIGQFIFVNRLKKERT